jgi:pilus assembly protein CpaC
MTPRKGMQAQAWFVALLAGLAAVSCSAPKKHEPELSEEFRETLERMNENAGQAVRDAMDRQRLSPEEAKTASSPSAVTRIAPGEPIWIQSGKSQALRFDERIERVSLADPELAGIVVLDPQTILINAKALEKEGPELGEGVQMGRSGTFLGRTLTDEPNIAETTLVVWGSSGMDAHTLVIADFVNKQVMLEVTVAEVNRTALERHGIDFRIIQKDLIAAGFLAGGAPPIGNVTVPPQVNQPLLPLRRDSLNPTYVFIDPNEDVTLFLQALQTEGLARVLAQPTIVAMSGQTAVFQVGGEIPIRISTGLVADIEFKPFGTLVNFVPRVSEEGSILLTVTPEVSEPDFNNTVEGIPTFRTRRASTSTRLESGQTVVIGGLLQTAIREEVSGVPYLKDLPFLGYAFRSTRYEKGITELLVVAKPTLMKPLPAGSTLPMPSQRGPLTQEENRTQPESADQSRPRLPLLEIPHP